MEDTKSISDASKASGLSMKQLREYEAKGYIPESVKLKCGSIQYRRYTEDQIEALKVFKSFMDQGFTLSAAKIKTGEYLGKEKTKFSISTCTSSMSDVNRKFPA